MEYVASPPRFSNWIEMGGSSHTKYFFTQKGGGSFIMGKVSMTIKKEMFNKAYLPYLQDYSKRFSVFYGGA